MKRLITTTLIVLAVVSVNRIQAQYCGNSGPSVCNASGLVSGQGFQNMDSLPCMVQDSAYNSAIQFTMYNAFNFQGQQSVDSIEFLGIGNLPCGVCWASSKASNRFKAGEIGCVNFSGVPKDSAGQYKLALTLKAWINNGPTGLPIPPNTVSQTGIAIYVRVRKPNGPCDTVNTTGSATNLTASCTAGINDVLSDVGSMSIVPNPMNSSSILSFTSEVNATYLMRISNIAGQQISSKEVEATTGKNHISIERNNLPAGIYFVTLSKDRASVTQKLVIME